jgi:glycosyltransferase involved in cell wall biosynthesis
VPATAEANLPSCSVIIPTRGRPRQLAECLQSIAETDYPPERLEVIVVDDGGSSSEIDTPFEVSTLRSDNAGPAAARNA